jgi:hypothetical protein
LQQPGGFLTGQFGPALKRQAGGERPLAVGQKLQDAVQDGEEHLPVGLWAGGDAGQQGVVVPSGVPPVAGTTPDREVTTSATDEVAHDAAGKASGAVAAVRPTPARLAGAILCLAVVVGAIATGLYVVVSGGH